MQYAYGSTIKSRQSNCNIEKKHDHWLCKGITLHGKRPKEQHKMVGKMTEVHPPEHLSDTVRRVMEISHN